jgi:hypothetical protein
MSGWLCCLAIFNDSVAGMHQQGWHRSDGRDEEADRPATNPAGLGNFKL